MAASDEGLLSKAIDGDQDALAELLSQHGSSLEAYIEPKISNRHQSVLSAEDVLQETFADAFLDIGRFVPQGDGAFPAWLKKLADRNLIDAIRMLDAEKRGGQRRRIEPVNRDESLTSLYEIVAATTSTPSRGVARGEAKSAITRAIEQLPEGYRRVVEMYDIEGLSVAEVVEALKRSPGAVFMLRARAHRRLAELMGTASDFLSGSA